MRYPDDELLTTEEAAPLLDVKTGTLEVWRLTKRYKLPYVKIGRNVRYKKSDILNFISAHTVAE